MAPRNTKKTSSIAGLNPNSQQNREVFQRLNFLNQAAHYLATVTTSTEHQDNQIESTHQKIQTQPDCQTNLSSNDTKETYQPPLNGLSMIQISRRLSKSIKVIARKSVTRIDPSVKRTLCKSCQVLLIPGYTSKTRLKKSGPHRHTVNTVCLMCQYRCRIPHPPLLPSPDSILPSDNQHPSDSSAQLKPHPQARPLPFWKKPEHVTFVGQTQVD